MQLTGFSVLVSFLLTSSFDVVRYNCGHWSVASVGL